MADEQAPAPQEGGGGGFAEALARFDKIGAAVTQAVTQNPQVPDELKQRAAALREEIGSFAEALVDVASQGGAQAAPAGPRGAVSPEQGGSEGAVPMSPA